MEWGRKIFYEEEAVAMESALSWTLTNTNHHSITVLFCTDSPCVKPSSHLILEHSPSTIPSIPFCRHSLSSGSMAILPFQVTISPKKQSKKPPPSPQAQFLLIHYLALFKSLTKRFVTLHQYTNGLLLLQTSKGFSRSKTDKQQKRWRLHCSLTIRSPPFSPPTWSFTRPHLSESLPRRKRSPSLAPWLSSFVNHETTSLWVTSRIIRVAFHSTWGCSGVCKEDPGQPWRLTQ